MSTTATQANTSAAPTTLTDKQQAILEYLRAHADTQTYFKSRLIGEALDMSAKEVGTNMTPIEKGDFDVDVEKWGYSSSTTWMVTA